MSARDLGFSDCSVWNAMPDVAMEEFSAERNMFDFLGTCRKGRRCRRTNCRGLSQLAYYEGFGEGGSGTESDERGEPRAKKPKVARGKKVQVVSTEDSRIPFKVVFPVLNLIAILAQIVTKRKGYNSKQVIIAVVDMFVPYFNNSSPLLKPRQYRDSPPLCYKCIGELIGHGGFDQVYRSGVTHDPQECWNQMWETNFNEKREVRISASRQDAGIVLVPASPKSRFGNTRTAEVKLPDRVIYSRSLMSGPWVTNIIMPFYGLVYALGLAKYGKVPNRKLVEQMLASCTALKVTSGTVGTQYISKKVNKFIKCISHVLMPQYEVYGKLPGSRRYVVLPLKGKCGYCAEVQRESSNSEVIMHNHVMDFYVVNLEGPPGPHKIGCDSDDMPSDGVAADAGHGASPEENSSVAAAGLSASMQAWGERKRPVQERLREILKENFRSDGTPKRNPQYKLDRLQAVDSCPELLFTMRGLHSPHGMAHWLGMNNEEELKQREPLLHGFVDNVKERCCQVMSATMEGFSEDKFEIKHSVDVLMSMLTFKRRSLQMWHTDIKREHLHLLDVHGHVVMLVMGPLTEDGMWLRVMPEVPFVPDESSPEGYKFDRNKPLTWGADLPVLNSTAMAEYMGSSKTGQGNSGHTKKVDVCDGVWVFVPVDNLIIIPASLHHGGNYRTSANGNERLHMFFLFERKGAAKSIRDIIGDSTVVHYAARTTEERILLPPRKHDVEANGAEKEAGDTKHDEGNSVEGDDKVWLTKGVRHFAEHFMM